MDLIRHQGTVAVVTGAASGIGRATALRLAGEGALVVATDVTAEGLATLAADHPAIATVLSWLASSEASYVNGAVVSADGGWKAA